MLGEPGRPQRNGRIPVLQTTLEQKAGGLGVGQGGGAPERYSRPSAGPAGKFTAPKGSLWKLPSSEKGKPRAWASDQGTPLFCLQSHASSSHREDHSLHGGLWLTRKWQ